MKNRLKWLLAIIAAGLIICVLARTYLYLTDDFRVANITYELPFREDWEIPPLSMENQTDVINILSQKFSYIGKGEQSYAFVSEDQRYVIKFIKFKHIRPSFFMKLLHSSPFFLEWQTDLTEKKKRKLHNIFSGYCLAYQADKEGAGLLFLHFNSTKSLDKKLQVIDKIGLHWEVDLDRVPFILQRKAEPASDVISDLLIQGDMASAKMRFRQMIDLQLSEYQKGMHDRDHSVMRNVGFVGEMPIRFDVGKLSKNNAIKDRIHYQIDDLEKTLFRIDLWLRKHYSNERDELMMDIREHIHSSTAA